MWSTLTTFTTNQKRVFFGISLSYILSWCPGIMTAPFLPSEAALHGVSAGLTGILFSVNSITQIIASPCLGFLIGKFGPKKAVILGVLISSAGCILTGTLQHVDGKWTFFSLCFIALMFLGVGITAVYTSSLTYAAKLFPENMNMIVGATEGYIGIGEMIALPFGGVLTDAAGFQAPFLLFGVLILLTLPLNLWLLPTDDMKAAKLDRKALEQAEASANGMTVDKHSSDDQSATDHMHLSTKAVKLRPWNVLSIAPAFFMIVVVVVTGVSWLFIATTFEPHVAPLGLSKTGVGSLFTVSPAVYIVACPAWGYLADKIHVSKRYLILVMGLLLGGLSFSLLGPLPMLGIPNSIASNIVALVVVTIWLAAAFVPACELALMYCVQAGYEDNIETYATVSGWISMFFAVGAAIGSATGGYLVEAIEYPYTAGVFGLNCIFWGLVILVIFGCKLSCSTPRVVKRL